MASRTFTTILFFMVLVTAILITSYQRSSENKLLQSFERNVNSSLCTLCLGNDSFCSTLDFQLDYSRHSEINQHSNYVSIFLVVLMRMFNHWTNQLNDKIFFGTLKLKNGTIVQVVAKSPGYYYSEMFEQIVNVSADIDTMIALDQWNLFLLSTDRRNLTICSKDDEKSFNSLFSSIISTENINNSQLHMETWIAAHLSVELLYLKILSGNRYVPYIFGTCGRIYFVEDCGHTLQYHLNKMNLSNRLLVAKELLKLALEFTDGTVHPDFSFYFTDLTADNIAIQLDKTTGLLLSLKIIDWSDIIVVVNNHSNTSNNNSSVHTCEHVSCGVGCLVYSKEDICQARKSDFNVYAICKEFFSDGNLLRGSNNLNNLQNNVDKELEYLVKHCLWNFNVDQGANKSRLDTAKLLILTLERIFEQSVYDIVKN